MGYWLPGPKLLRGISRITGDDLYVVTIATNGYVAKSVIVSDPNTKAEFETIDAKLMKLTLARDDNGIAEWTVSF